jgi:multidrug efflux pump subunit AcrA (membrane-fusion protein)
MPYTNVQETLTGYISEINPLVSANGMVRVKATINDGQKLFDGMNVRVSVKRVVPNQFVVPKTAIVLRSGKQVLFTLQDSIAIWNYVQTGLENMTEYTLINTEDNELKEGMIVITAGNVNLAHESVVKKD